MKDYEAAIRTAIRRGEKYKKTNNYYHNNGEDKKKSRTQATMSAVNKFRPTSEIEYGEQQQ